MQWPCTSWRCCVQAYGDDILLHLNVANFLPSIPLQLLTVRWRDQPGADARRGGERWVWARLLLGAAEWIPVPSLWVPAPFLSTVLKLGMLLCTVAVRGH